MADATNQPAGFGRSLELDDGDLLIADNDLVLVAGRANLLQGLQVMILTGAGTDVFNVNYGFDFATAFTAALPRSSAQDLIRLNLVKSISQDNRVVQIKELVFDDDPRYYELLPFEDPVANAQTRGNQRKWQALVIIQTIADGDVAFQIDSTGLNA
jgi:hypothetical protein